MIISNSVGRWWMGADLCWDTAFLGVPPCGFAPSLIPLSEVIRPTCHAKFTWNTSFLERSVPRDTGVRTVALPKREEGKLGKTWWWTRLTSSFKKDYQTYWNSKLSLTHSLDRWYCSNYYSVLLSPRQFMRLRRCNAVQYHELWFPSLSVLEFTSKDHQSKRMRIVGKRDECDICTYQYLARVSEHLLWTRAEGRRFRIKTPKSRVGRMRCSWTT